MKSVRIYKDNIREHVLRSLFFTDTAIAIGGAIVIAAVVFVIFKYFLHFFDWGYYGLTVLTCEVFFIGLVTQKLDNQPIYKIVPRGLKHSVSKKNLRHADIDSYFTDFAIQDNLIVRKNSIISMLAVEPYDIALLNDQDREHFFVKIKQMIHVLPSGVQFIIRKERATMEEYSKHVSSLYKDANTKREPLIHNYLKDLSDLISNHSFVTMRHYAVFSVSCDSKKANEKVKAIKKLSDMSIRFASALSACNITATPLTNNELLHVATTTLR